MPERAPQRRLLREEELNELFSSRGIPFTIQRRAVLEELAGRSDHPTADGVYEAVVRRVPGLSRATVYRALETLVELGLANRICHPGSSARYDPKTWRHHHLICEGCGAVVDLEAPELDALRLPAGDLGEFVIRDYSVQFTGLCAACARERGDALTRR